MDRYVLQGFWGQKQKESESDPAALRLDCWFRISSIIVSEDDFEYLKSQLSKISLIDPHIVSAPRTQGYLGEYPWHPVYDTLSNWQADSSFHDIISKRHFIPVTEYFWEKGSCDFSIEESLSFYLPAKEFVDDLGLTRNPNSMGCWEIEKNVVFSDPSIAEYGPIYALIHEDMLRNWMTKKGLKIMWLIGGQKQLL